ncbi:MAG: hypothetical protein MR788_05085, partial [Prevotella sp.]|nr:hypothetical protein [Prevotella sp.]
GGASAIEASFIALDLHNLSLVASCFASSLSHLLEIALLLERGCKGIDFLQTSKTCAGKSWIFSLILTDIYN